MYKYLLEQHSPLAFLWHAMSNREIWYGMYSLTEKLEVISPQFLQKAKQYIDTKKSGARGGIRYNCIKQGGSSFKWKNLKSLHSINFYFTSVYCKIFYLLLLFATYIN